MLSKHVRDAFLQLIAEGKQDLASYESPSWLHSLEARYTLLQLEHIVLYSAPVIEDALLDCFKARWQRVQQSDVQYLHDFINPANRVCIAIAKQLGGLLQRPYLLLIMPSLAEVPITDYTTSSYAEDLNLKEMILSDCNQHMICIPDVLDGAQVDGVLKHNSLFQKRVKVLSESEQHRVLSRHPTVKTAYEALQARVAFKLHGNTVGAALARLITGLRAGGESTFSRHDPRRQNVSFDSGKEANEAIFEFNIYLESLDDETRAILMSANKEDQFSESASESIAMFWARLTRPSHLPGPSIVIEPALLPVSETPSEQPPLLEPAMLPDPAKRIIRPPLVDYRSGGVYCVELIANGLEAILKVHPELYDLESYHGEVSTNLAALDEATMQAGNAMHLGLSTITRQVCYGARGMTRFFVNLLCVLNKEPYFLLRVEEVACIADKYASSLRLSSNKEVVALSGELLTSVSRRYGSQFVINAVDRMSSEGRQQFIKLTNFEMPQSSLQQAGNVLFFGDADRFKRRAAEAELTDREGNRRRLDTDEWGELMEAAETVSETDTTSTQWGDHHR